MRKAIVIGIMGLTLVSNRAAAQTAVEQAAILRDFQLSVMAYTSQHGLATFPQTMNAAAPAPKIFTLPVAMVFRQLIARAVHAGPGAAIGGTAPSHHAAAMQPFPASELCDFPPALTEVLPPLPAPLEYRLIGEDLVIRDGHADLIVAILRNALGTTTTNQ